MGRGEILVYKAGDGASQRIYRQGFHDERRAAEKPADYEPSLSETNKFFSVIQNKRLPHMGLASWKADEVRKTDVTVAEAAKN